MNDTPTQSIETKRKPMRTARRIRFSQLPEPIQQMALDNLIYHRDAESVARRFEVHESDLVEALVYKLYDQVRTTGPRGPATVLQMRRAA